MKEEKKNETKDDEDELTGKLIDLRELLRLLVKSYESFKLNF